MKKTILVLAIVTVIFTALAVAAAPSGHSDGDSKSYWVHYYHTYYRPVFFRPVYVTPVVYPVYTYHYWYYKFAGR